MGISADLTSCDLMPHSRIGGRLKVGDGVLTSNVAVEDTHE